MSCAQLLRRTAWLALPLLAAACSGGRAAPARGVLLVLADTLRKDRLGCYGDVRGLSPQVDALAAQGLCLERTYSQGCWTVPSMISMFSGQYFSAEPSVLPTDRVVLAETLQAAGVRTAAFVGNTGLARERGFERGFDEWHTSGEQQGLMADFVPLFGAWRAAERARDPESAWFAWVHVLDVHHPYASTPWSRAHTPQHRDERRLLPLWRAAEARFQERFPAEPGPGFSSLVDELRRTSHAYDGEVELLDQGLGQLIGGLRASGEWDDTLVIFAADHGEMLFDQANYPAEQTERTAIENPGRLGLRLMLTRGHSTWWYEPIWNVPLVLAGGALPRALCGRSSALHANLDLFPTICAALGVPLTSELGGQNLLDRALLERGHALVFGEGREGRAVVDALGRKLIEQPRQRLELPGEGDPAYQFYDLAADPYEERDLAARDPQGLEPLRTQLDLWRAQHPLSEAAAETSAMRAALERLGYLGNQDP